MKISKKDTNRANLEKSKREGAKLIAFKSYFIVTTQGVRGMSKFDDGGTVRDVTLQRVRKFEETLGECQPA